MRPLAVGLCFLALLFVACAGRTPSRPDGSRLPPGVVCEWTPVVRVVDGDTIRVLRDGAEERVRYIGVDTPELAHPTHGVEPFGPEAAAYNEELVDGRSLCLETDVSDRDRFGRLLRYAWLEDGTMVNELLVAAGMARVATFPPDVKYTESLLLPAQQAAAEAGRGLWGR
ncbi:MAG: thermonuclease family protein [Chloroflexi bacterium]|nr:thermonuclease family protein [Dehalococcoidia bacterium]MCO5202123.1 thermonuclease family protein [Chloroflexota bacterium]